MTTRAARRAQTPAIAQGETPAARRRREHRQSAQPAPSKLRVVAFLAVAAVVVAVGLYFAGSVFLGQRDKTNVAGAVAMRVSMDGFDPNILNAKPGETITLDWWNDDAPMHLTNGVHSLVSTTLNVRFELPAQSRKTISLTAPMLPGDYDFWCDSCCGGIDNPKMHATLHVGA